MDLAREIVTRNPDLIVTGTNPVVKSVTAATSTRHRLLRCTCPLLSGKRTLGGRGAWLQTVPEGRLQRRASLVLLNSIARAPFFQLVAPKDQLSKLRS